MVPVEKQAQVLALYFGQKMGTRRIAREVGINRKTVCAIIERRCVRAQISGGPRLRRLDAYKAEIEECLRKDPLIPSTVILQRLRKRGYTGGVSSLRSYVAAARPLPRPREAFLKLEFEAGQCAQVDWGEFGDVFADGIKIHAFVMVLCYSRRLYVEFTRSEKFEDFIRCHENAFAFFQGAPRECWYDNLATCVTERVGRLIRFNARFHAYLGHHGILPYACTPARGNEKGRVEDGVRFLRTSFWPGRTFQDFNDLRVQSTEWLTQIANSREHRSTRKIPDLVFKNEEQSLLLPLNPHAYDTDEVFSKVVPPQCHIPYETNAYSVPWTLVGLPLTVRVSADDLKFFYNNQCVASHARHYRKHLTITHPDHLRGLLERKPGAKDHWQIRAIKSMGVPMEQYLNLLKSGQRSLRFEVSRLLALATVYGEAELVNMIDRLLNEGVIGVENVELALKAKHSPKSPEPISFQNQKLNHMSPSKDLRHYDQWLIQSTKGEE